MKKILTIIATAAMLAVSCQKEIAPESGDNASATGKLTATIVKTSTKVTYSETPELNLQPAWEVGDKIIGFDDAGNTYTLTVASVDAETATLSADKEIADGALHLIYKSGAKASDISSKTLAIDYSAQKGNKTMPAVMLADGTVTDGACDFAFTNAGAIIGISAVNGVPSGATISKITIEGSNLSAATVALSGSALALTATTAATDAISTATLSGITTTDANGTLSSPIFIAVPAGAKIKKVSASVAARTPETMTIPSTAADKNGIDYVEIEAKYDGTNVTTKKWAKWNVGANNEKDYGWYFAWAGTEGYVRKNSKWVSASGVDTYSYKFLSAKTTVAGVYLYVKTQSFAVAGHSFNWVNTPYQTQNNTDFDNLKFTKYLGSTTSKYKDPSATDEDALKTVLDPEDDAATVNWREPWRMPTPAEFQALYDATYWAWDSTDKGCYVYTPNPATDAGKYNSGTGTYDKSNALLFFPAAGYGLNSSLQSAGSGGSYWSSSLGSSDPSIASNLFFYCEYVELHNLVRYDGRSVRPVSD